MKRLLLLASLALLAAGCGGVKTTNRVADAARTQCPSKAIRGSYRLSLALPDDAGSLSSRPEYSVRLANPGVWDAKEGVNILAEDVKISDNAPGLATPGVKEFTELR